jgi:hypothetical protein
MTIAKIHVYEIEIIDFEIETFTLQSNNTK